MSGTPEYRTWIRMLSRCFNVASPSYADYGERGICVCVSWCHDFAVFLTCLGPRPSAEYSLDRIDNDGGYWCGKAECPECGPLGREPNCRWATGTTQARNTRRNHRVTAFGTSKTIVEWAEGAGLSRHVVGQRIRSGWNAERAVTTPLVRKGRRTANA